MGHEYNHDFMSYADRTSRSAAQVVAKLLRGWLPVRSLLDVGCATGTWLSVWREAGVDDILGVDGDYVSRSALVVPAGCFVAHDLSQPFDFSRRFDLVQSLEVAEHLPASAADTFVDNLVRHAQGFILFSAAPPGQGGEFHVNEQPYEYWRKKFAARGYVACDCLRPRLAGDPKISFWYRYNTVLYVADTHLRDAPKEVRASVVPPADKIPDVAPMWFKIRKTIVRQLPIRAREWLARTKARRYSH